MTPAQILAAVLVDQALRDMAHASNWQGIADALSATATRASSTPVTMRGGAAKFPAIAPLPGPLAFTAAVRKLREWAAANIANPDSTRSLLAEAVQLQLDGFKALGLDFSDPALLSMLALLVQLGAITPADSDGFALLARVPDQVSEYEVRLALFNDDGTLKV